MLCYYVFSSPMSLFYENDISTYHISHISSTFTVTMSVLYLLNQQYIVTSSNTSMLLVKIVVGQLAESKMKERQMRAGSRVLPSCCPSPAWCSSQRLTTGAKRSSSAGCRAESNKSRSFPWSVPGRSFRFLWLRLSLETLLL